MRVIPVIIGNMLHLSSRVRRTSRVRSTSRVRLTSRNSRIPYS